MNPEARLVLRIANAITFLGGMALPWLFMLLFAPVFHSVLWCLCLLARGE